MKRCYKCNLVQSFENYHKQSSCKDGYKQYCKKCIKIMFQEYSNRYVTTKISMNTKTCGKCNKVKDVADFDRCSYQKSTYKVYCRDCELERNQKYRKELKETHRDAIEQKKCGCCRILKDINEFVKDINTKSGYASYCNECQSKKTMKYRNGNILKNYCNPLDNKFKICNECNESKLITKFSPNKINKDGLNTICKKCTHKKSSAKNKLIKTLILDNYGHECVGCGNKDDDILTIDHINNDGWLERKTEKNSLYRRLIKLGFPKDNFQVLCYNCNIKKYKLTLKDKYDE